MSDKITIDEKIWHDIQTDASGQIKRTSCAHFKKRDKPILPNWPFERDCPACTLVFEGCPFDKEEEDDELNLEK